MYRNRWRFVIKVNLANFKADSQCYSKKMKSKVLALKVLKGYLCKRVVTCTISDAVVPGKTYLTTLLLQIHHSKFLYKKKKAAVDTVLKTGRRTEKGGRWALKPGLLAWHGSPFNSPCKVFTISLSLASLSRKWGQRITWRGGKKVPKWKGFCLANGEPLPVAFPGKKGIFFLSFLLLNPQSLVSYSGGRWRKGRRKRGKNEKKKTKKKTWGPLRDLNLFKCECAFCFCNPVKNGHLIRSDISGQREPVC